MRDEPKFTAALIHTSGSECGRREQIEMPLAGPRPPIQLSRPVNLGGAPSFEDWVLASLDEWTVDSPVALYKFVGHRPRDPMTRDESAAGALLPWRR